jgi:hypothetical protein
MFNSGLEAMERRIDSAKQRSGGGQGQAGAGLSYFSWKPGDKKVLRFLADDVITEEMYDFIVDRTGSTKNFLIDPSDPGRLDRYRSPSPGIGWRNLPKSSKFEPPKAKTIGAAVAVLRHEVPGPEGRMVVEDVILDKTINEQTFPARHFGVVQQGMPNFWRQLIKGYFKRYGTLTDRDYEITREGASLDTTYNIVPLDVDPDLDSPDKVRAFYFYGEPWDEEDPQRFLKCPMTTLEWAKYYSGEERHKHWLTPQDGQESNGLGEFHKDTTHNPADEAQAAAPSNTQFSSLKETLLAKARPQQGS